MSIFASYDNPKLLVMDDNKYIILIAEDTDSNYLLLETILKHKYKLIRAINGKEAVQICQEVNPDLILMDIRMPEMDGLEATQLIRQFNHEVTIFALTAFAFDHDKRNALDAGCNGFITKPINIADLKATIQKCFEKSPVIQ